MTINENERDAALNQFVAYGIGDFPVKIWIYYCCVKALRCR
jgi:hypothetical protein